MAHEDNREDRSVSWAWVIACTFLGALFLALAGWLEAMWDWKGVTTEALVHVGGTFLLAALLFFLEGRFTRSVARANAQVAKQVAADLRVTARTLNTRIDEIQTKIDQQEADHARQQDEQLAALGQETSFLNVTSAMAVANDLGALPEGDLTVSASLNPRIDITFSWQFHNGDPRFEQATGVFLGVNAELETNDAGGGTPIVNTVWQSSEMAEDVAVRINRQLQTAGRWNGPSTLNWTQIFERLHAGLDLAVAARRKDDSAAWRLHGGLYELHGDDWAITEAGLERRGVAEPVIGEGDFPPRQAFRHAWRPPPAPDGVAPEDWAHLLARGRLHLPVYKGPRGEGSMYYAWPKPWQEPEG